MKVIGLCGGSGSGKSRFAAFFADRGIPTQDADAVYHEIIARRGDCLRELVTEYGAGILADDGSLSRKALAAIVFAPDAMRDTRVRRLSEITHKYVIREIDAFIAREAEKGTGILLIDVPLLFESGLSLRCDLTVAVLADRETRIRRIVARDGLDYEAAKRRIDAQPSDDYYRLRADRIVYNDGDAATLSREADDILSLCRSPLIPLSK